MNHLTYFFLLIGSVFFPVVLSFDKKVNFISQWKIAFIAGILPALFFIIWDEIFVRLGVWKFNPQYISGILIGSLPLEEILFFIAIPFACTFIFACVDSYWKKTFSEKYVKIIGWFFVGFMLLVALLYLNRIYTFTTFLCSSVSLALVLIFSSNRFLSVFYVTWILHLIPLFIVNGFLTALPVLIYNNSENSGFRLGSIPVEDFFYSLTLTIWNYFIFERLKASRK